VAKEAGVSRGLVYHYFPNKKDFYSAIVRYGMRNAFELTAPDTSLPPDQWLTNSVERLLHYVETNADAFRAVFSARLRLRGYASWFRPKSRLPRPCSWGSRAGSRCSTR
jgi:AcrR family transcriptional regulator